MSNLFVVIRNNNWTRDLCIMFKLFNFFSLGYIFWSYAYYHYHIKLENKYDHISLMGGEEIKKIIFKWTLGAWRILIKK